MTSSIEQASDRAGESGEQLFRVLLAAGAVILFAVVFLLGRGSITGSPSIVAAPALSLPEPASGFEPMSFVNYETPHVSPLALTPDGTTLLAVNTAANSLLVFTVETGTPVLADTIAVGMEPVSVAARTNDEAWVVNHLSDTVSVVDLAAGVVVDTLATDDEPADVVFAGSPQRAFVSASQVNRVNVFDPANRRRTPERIVIAGEDPRMLAVSPDGRTVYAAIFESGNGTTTMAGGKSLPRIDDVVANPLSPYGGQTVIPNNGGSFVPALNPANPAPPPVSMIVRKQGNGAWLDDNGGDWSRFVTGDLARQADRVPGWDLPDRDVAVIDAATLGVSYQGHLMNLVMAVAVNPATGEVTAVGTDATNEVRFEPVLNGRFLRVNYASFAPGGQTRVQDLNPHLDYSVSSVGQSTRDLSVGDPRSIAWRADGQQALVAGMGSNNVLVIGRSGNIVDRIEVGEGPTGVAISESRNRAFVLNRFDGSLSVVDLGANRVVDTVTFFDPTPGSVTAGRQFLYDTHTTSGLGHVSCASCHVDARTDRLAWDLGNPAGEMETRVDTDGREWQFHPMKGPMKTQTLQDIIGSPSLHHRGDRDDLFGFADAFPNLQGDDAPLDTASMTDYEAFLDTIHFPPNPNRNIDNSFATSVPIQGSNSGVQRVGNAAAGLTEASHCLSCHNNQRGRSDTMGPNGLHDDQPAIAEPLGGFYDRMGFFWDAAEGSTSGFGFRTDGSQDSTFREEGTTANHIAFFLSWEGPKPGLPGISRDSHAGVGQQAQISANQPSTSGDPSARTLVAIADSGDVGLIVTGTFDGQRRGFAYTGGNQFQSDALDEVVALSELEAGAAGGDTLVFTLVPRGSEYRLGVDADLDGVPNRDDDDPDAVERVPWIHCAVEGGVCEFDGPTTVRYGSPGSWLYAVLADDVSCFNETFGDPSIGIIKGCWYASPDSVSTEEWVECVGEGARCEFEGSAEVRFGTVDDHVIETHVNGVDCTVDIFGDPARGADKQCWTLVDHGPVWVECATEGGRCVFSGVAQVRYGTADDHVIRTHADGVACSNSVFGDPAPGIVKRCWTLSGDDPGPGPEWIECAVEGGRCVFSGVAPVRYGTVDDHVIRTHTDGVACSNSVFGDPVPNVRKSCWVLGDPDPAPVWVECATEGGRCSFSGVAQVRYGVGERFVTRTFADGVACTNAAFGFDPTPGVVKACSYQRVAG